MNRLLCKQDFHSQVSEEESVRLLRCIITFICFLRALFSDDIRYLVVFVIVYEVFCVLPFLHKYEVT